MRIKKFHKKIFRDVFFYLIFITSFLSFYDYFEDTIPNIILARLWFLTVLFGGLYIYLNYFVKNKVKIIVKKIKNVEMKLIIFLIFLIPYSFFLSYAFKNFSFSEFMFFVLIPYLPLSLILGIEPRIPIAIAILFLIYSAILLSYGFESLANDYAILCYYFLLIGVILLIFDEVLSKK